jgi:ornithine cyclodeaminase/alanine dehydrogenase-like protein (mu-crystallin family)
MVRYLNDNEIRDLLTMPRAIALMREAFIDRAEARAFDVPLKRTHQPGGHLKILQAAAPKLNLIGYKASYNAKGGSSLLHLYDQKAGSLEAIIETGWLGSMRTAATTGVAVDELARPDSAVVACIGCGKHAGRQLEAVAAVRGIREARAFNRDPTRRRKFCDDMGAKLGIRMVPTERLEDALNGADIVNVMTNTRSPVVEGRLLSPGQHVTAAGANSLDRRELDLEAVRRADVVVVDSREVAREQCGDLLPAYELGIVHWDNVTDLSDLVSKRRAGRASPTEITLFESHGMCIEDIYVGWHVLGEARRLGIGIELPIGAGK